ncbi:response regulator receiver domain [Aeromonas hydrophila]|uniref:Response receiver domain-containing protein n=1 Tax=Aeromonas hydrophila TaxID=644 RepID=A0ABD7G0E7_AERHY|nr:response regulator receiver domain [Aeromonas hydrophila]MBC8671380.1 hypothetical protein [Aeromonas hydrophila]MBC8690327.1 hypothetical protein [Aeromonas hydrophila]RCF42018.1 hypothetical protein C6C11_23405 [Aeromonas hydrophila]
MQAFTELSQSVIDKFIQNIIFIDDKAYNRGGVRDQHEFDAQEVTKIFSQKGKICAVYKPEVASDLDYLTPIAKKADVTILDWQMVLEEEVDGGADGDDEADAEVDDVRGVYTKKIISSLLSDLDTRNSIKLILVYTGEVDLQDIALSIESSLREQNIEGFRIHADDPCSVISSNCKVMVISKSNGGAGRPHLPMLADKIKRYDELPEFISKQFSEMTSGLLSIFAMESLSEIRRNFNHILTLFSKNLDAAYLAHQTLLPNTSDANELLVQLLSDTFSSIIKYKDLNHFLNEDVVKSWLEHNIVAGERPFYTRDGAVDRTASYLRNSDVLLELLKSNPNVKDKFCNSLSGIDGQQIPKSKIDILMRRYAATLFSELDVAEAVNKDFAKLCYHRSTIFSPEHLPYLSLGTVVKSTLNEGCYYICIQQRCDSVRIEDAEERRFLFISLDVVDNDCSFNFLTPDGTKLKINKSTYSLRTIKFNGTNGVALAKKNGEIKYFEPTYYSEASPEKFEFIVELKELYAQQIVESYSSSLSRVGLDEPEWVRRLN